MKKTRNLFATVLASVTLLAAVGCGSLGGGPIVEKPYVIEIHRTNDLGQVTSGFQTNMVASVNTNYLAAIAAAQQINATANPTPTAPLINIGLGALAAGLGWYARIKNQKANGAQALVDTLIAGVEQSNSAETKTTIAKVAQIKGTSTALHAEVKKSTG